MEYNEIYRLLAEKLIEDYLKLEIDYYLELNPLEDSNLIVRKRFELYYMYLNKEIFIKQIIGALQELINGETFWMLCNGYIKTKLEDKINDVLILDYNFDEDNFKNMIRQYSTN